MLPSITILIPTYARVRWLEQALHSALTQDYDGEVRVVVLNDCAQQTLQVTDSRVRVINLAKRFATLGEKRNALTEYADTEWVTTLDDDDFLLPWHCQKRVAEGVRLGVPVVDAASSWFYQRPNLSCVGGILVDLVMRRDLMLCRYPAIDVGEDREFRSLLAAQIGPLHKLDNRDAPSYVYCWGNGVFHISGSGETFNGGRYLTEANARLHAGDEPSGVIQLKPQQGFDPAWVIAAMRLPYPHDFTTRTAP